jgi:Ca2+-binding RTX toxin-like protein
VTVQWAAGDVDSFDVDLTAFNDTLLDTNQSLTLSLTGAAVTAGAATIPAADESATLTILDTDAPPPNILNGTLITNTNSTNQSSILTIAEVDNPFNAYATWNQLDLQGQQGSLNKDVGFNIDPADDYKMALEVTGQTKAIVTDFTLESAVINAPGGSDNPQLEVDGSASGTGGNNFTAITAVFSPDDPAIAGNDSAVVQGQTLSLDGSSGNETLNDPLATTFNYLAGDAGNDTLNSGAGSDILNGGAGADSVYGNGGNDILVYDKNDTILDGGAGVDLLRIDGDSLTNSTVDLAEFNLAGAKDISGIEGLLITDDHASSDSIGTTLVLTAADVLDITSGNTDQYANTLRVLGNEGDVLDLSPADNWQIGGTVDGFVSYTSTAATTPVTLLVDSDVNVNLT